MRIVSGVVKSAYGVPEGIFEKPVDRDWLIAARGGTASGKESEFLAMKRAVEARAIIFRGRERVGIVPSAIVGGGDGEEGIGSMNEVRRLGDYRKRVSISILISGRNPAPATPSLRRASATWWAGSQLRSVGIRVAYIHHRPKRPIKLLSVRRT